MPVSVTVRALPRGIKSLEQQSDVGHLALRPVAEEVLQRARPRAPSWTATQAWRWWTKAGKGPSGAFAQAIITGSGAQLAEWGGTRSRPYAMLRSSLP